ncbi:phosphotransferase [Nostoc sp. LPT]|uniref:phosphotransferase n=1 Tax=Nostoc sp. LPT TaxID=2815387 RepID=UPI0025DC03B7|nr:phosphotransferase [Nostoc sp. LPT]
MSKKTQLSEQDVTELLDLWSFPNAPTFEPTNRGTSNTTYFVNGQAGNFILKLYGDSTSTEQIQYEHSLLAYLQQVNLSFAVPAPVAAKSGESLVHVSKNHTLLRVALLPLISGQIADRQNCYHARAAGRTLGELHSTLAGFDPEGQLAQLPAWGDLCRIHPLVPDPLELPKLLVLPLEQQGRLIKTLTEVLEAMPKLYQTLPVQTIHADYLSFNILLEENQVVGVLDFEFATRDLRLVDYICGLDDYSMFPWRQNPRWEFLEAFNAGYAEHILLTYQEVEAMITAWCLQRVSSIIYMGRVVA